MISNRYTVGQSSAIRKSRLEGKPSLLPKPRRPGSSDRLSTESRRPSNVGHRSSSAEPARGTFGARLSREASATKLVINGRSHSQTGDTRYGQAAITPQRSNHYSRATTTPVRTPSGDRLTRGWEASLDRALAFVIIKDQRPISNVAWQRTEYTRVSEALAARGETSGMAFIRPLTITRFVDTVGAILTAIIKENSKIINNDNYVTKLPHLCRRLLYPGAVSKSWLRTVNTLHAFPHALALVAYLLDLVTHVETPVLDEWLYLDKDDLGCLRRDYLYKCWLRFQDPDHQFEDLNEDYLQNLKLLLGNDEEKIAELQQIIQRYSSALEEEEARGGRAEEVARAGRRAALADALREVRTRRGEARGGAVAARGAAGGARAEAARLDAQLERAASELQRVCEEVRSQVMCVSERGRVLDELDYALRVHDSKRALADEIRKMVASKETELALWQKKTLESCAEYRQRLIRLSGLPALAPLAVDEKELMGAGCLSSLSSSVSVLREEVSQLSARRQDLQRARALAARRTRRRLEETRTKISSVSEEIERSRRDLEEERWREAEESRAWAGEWGAGGEREARLLDLEERRREGLRLHGELTGREADHKAWVTKLTEMKEYIENQKASLQKKLQLARDKRGALVLDSLSLWNEKLGC